MIRFFERKDHGSSDENDLISHTQVVLMLSGKFADSHGDTVSLEMEMTIVWTTIFSMTSLKYLSIIDPDCGNPGYVTNHVDARFRRAIKFVGDPYHS